MCQQLCCLLAAIRVHFKVIMKTTVFFEMQYYNSGDSDKPINYLVSLYFDGPFKSCE